MRVLTKEKLTTALSCNVDLNFKKWVERGYFFLENFFSIGGSVWAEKIAMRHDEENAPPPESPGNVIFPEVQAATPAA